MLYLLRQARVSLVNGHGICCRWFDIGGTRFWVAWFVGGVWLGRFRDRCLSVILSWKFLNTPLEITDVKLKKEHRKHIGCPQKMSFVFCWDCHNVTGGKYLKQNTMRGLGRRGRKQIGGCGGGGQKEETPGSVLKWRSTPRLSWYS